MKYIKGILITIGSATLILGLILTIMYGSKISKLDSRALPEYMKMFDKVLETGDPAKGMILKEKMIIPEGMTKKEAIENALDIMDEVAEEHGLALVDHKTMPRKSGLYTHIRSYCSPTIADTFLNHSREFIGFMPCRIGIIEEPNGDIFIYTMNMDIMLNGGYTLSSEILKLGNEVRNGMNEIMHKGALGED